MRVIFDNNSSFSSYEPSAIALGTFDGIHLGHRALINELVYRKKKFGSQIIIYTFTRHPLTKLNPERVPPQIMLLPEKIRAFSYLDIDLLVLNDFNRRFIQQEPDDFVSQLLMNFNLKTLIVGYNFRFGYKGQGNVDLLRRFAEEKGFELVVVDPVKKEEEIVSSSLIRELIKEGNVSRAAECLGNPYSISGIIKHGYGRGKGLGFPTANLDYPKQKVIPKPGVYLTRCRTLGSWYWGVTNVGSNPTFSTGGLNIETHMLDFKGSLYKKRVRVFFVTRLRDEMAFSSSSGLVVQIRQDIIKAKNLIYKFL
jgi:riboflavin kinase/FMN adenylyltransferase